MSSQMCIITLIRDKIYNKKITNNFELMDKKIQSFIKPDYFKNILLNNLFNLKQNEIQTFFNIIYRAL